MKVVEYQDFSLRLHNKSVNAEKRIPINATFDVTHRCNNRCVHCYCSLPANDEKAISEELSAKEIEKLFDELRDMGCLWLLITGGEPLLRPDFRDIYLSAKRHGFIITVFTNGTLVDEGIADFFAQYPPFSVEITMYGATPETYERVTRVPGSYELNWSGLQRLVEKKVKLKLKTMALTINRHEIHQLDNIARGMGCEFRFDPILNKRLDDRKYSDPVKYRIPADDVVKLDMEFPERMKEHKEFCERMVGEPTKSDKLITCGAGRSSINILPAGMALPCSMLISRGESIREKSLREIWELDFQKLLDQKKDFSIKCDYCSLQNLCGQCTGWSLLEHGGSDKVVQYLCGIAQKRAETFTFLKNRMEEDYGKETMVKA